MITTRLTSSKIRRALSGLLALALLATVTLVAAPAANAESAGAPAQTPASVALEHLSAGANSTCAITVSSQVRCWGEFYDEVNAQPVTITGFSGTPDVISTGEQFACVILVGGDVECWGDNGSGQLGDGTQTESVTPVAVTGLAGPASALALEQQTACALLATGDVQCWGSRTSNPVPGGPYIAVSFSNEHRCMLKSEGDVFCQSDTSPPTSVAFPGVSASVSSGSREACALSTTGNVSCASFSISAYAIVSNATSVGTGDSHGCASLESGQVVCWPLLSGAAWDIGVYGESAPDQAQPVTIEGISGAVAVTSGYDHSCAALSTGAVQCWGYNEFGQTTDPVERSTAVPVRVVNAISVESIAAGRNHTCFAETPFMSWIACLGSGADGQLGDPTSDLVRIPRTPSGGADELNGATYSSIDTRSNTTCTVRDNNDVLCWGSGGVLQYTGGTFPDDGPRRNFSRALTAQVSLGGNHACIRGDSTGAYMLRCYGANDEGQVTGEQFGEPVLSSVVPPLPTGVLEVSEVGTGASHTCARLTRQIGPSAPTPQVWCWGNPGDGRTGITPANNATLRLIRIGGQIPESLAVGSAHGCVARSDGRVACWGQNTVGQLGNGNTNETNPLGQTELVEGITSADEVFAGLNHTCAIHNQRSTISCWGQGTNGQLGNGQMASSAIPVTAAMPAGETWKTMGLSNQHTCAVSTSGKAWCWGEGENGELGNLGITRSPITVSGITVSTSLVLPTCDGQAATHFAIAGQTTSGTPGNDVFWGSPGDDTINGLGGDDIICGNEGNDTIDGGDGADKIFGNTGDDTIYGGENGDTINSGGGHDIVYGENGWDRITGSTGDDEIYGGNGNDWVWAGPGADTLEGGPGNDLLLGFDGIDTIYAGGGNDKMNGMNDADIIEGGDGADQIWGGGGNDNIKGQGGFDWIWGRWGNDTIDGGFGNDRIFGEGGPDTINGGPGNDLIQGDLGDDILWGNSGNDEMYGGDQDDTINGGRGNDAIDGGFGTDNCNGNMGTNTVTRCEP